MYDYDDYNQYIIKVRDRNLRSYYIKFIDWETGRIEYTKDKWEAGGFEPRYRAYEVAEFLERQDFILKVEVIEV